MLTLPNILLCCVLAVSLYASSALIRPVSNPEPAYRTPRSSPERVDLHTKLSEQDIEQFTPEMRLFYEEIISGQLLGKDIRDVIIPDVGHFSDHSTCYLDTLIPLAKGRDEGPVLYIMSDRATNTIVSTGTTYNLD